MVSLFDDIAVFHYQDEICVSYGGESVGDYEAGSAFHEVIHGFLDLDFGSGVYGAGSFIEDQDLRVSQDGSGDREELFPLGRVWTKRCTWAALAAATTSSWVASSFPYLILSSMLPLNSQVS